MRSTQSESQTLRSGTDQPGYGATTSSASSDTIVNADDVANDSGVSGKLEPTPLPMTQIMLLTLTRVAEPLTFCVLFPFVNQMILDTGEVEVEDVGYSVGLVETSFSLTQVIFLMYWSRAADTWGRKPVLLCSLFGAFVASVAFGFSTQMWHMYAARCVAGIFGGNAVVIRTLFAENCDKTNQAKAFSFFAFAANIGSLLGPAMGGALAQPAKEYPWLFGNFKLFIDFPYALPCLAAGGYVFVVMVLCFFFLREPPRAKVDHAVTLREALKRPMPRMLLIYGLTVGISFSASALLPLHLFTPVPLGGSDMRPAQIAQWIAAMGLTQSLWLLIVMPYLDVRLGTNKLFTYTSGFFPLVMILPVLSNAAARNGSMVASYALLGVYVCFGSAVNMTFTSVQLLVNSTTPPAALSLINGLAQMIAASVKAFIPAIINAVYALGVSNQILGGYLAWFVMAAYGALVLIGAIYAPRDTEVEDSKDHVARLLESEGEAQID